MTTSPCGVMRLDRAVEELVALVHDVGLVVGPLQSSRRATPRLCMMPRTEISATRHARRARRLSGRPTPGSAAGADQVQERIAPAVGLIGVGLGRRWRRRRAAGCGGVSAGGGCARCGAGEPVRAPARAARWSRRARWRRRVHGPHHQAPFPARQPRVSRRASAGAGLSSSTNVVATQVAVIVEFGSGLSLPLTSSPLMFTMRVNLPTRSKKIARL